MAFSFDVNQTPIDGAAAVAQLVVLLTGTPGWSVHAYGDGTARTSGGSGFGASTLRDHDYAWVAVKIPGGGTDTLVFQRGDLDSGDNTAWMVAYAKGGLVTSGTGLGDGTHPDAPSTAGDLKGVWGTPGDPNPSPSNPTTAQLFPADNSGGAFRCSCGADGASPYAWWLACWNIGTGEGRTLLFMDPATVHASDGARNVLHADYRGSSAWVGTLDRVSDPSTGPLSWYRRGQGDAAWARSPAPVLYVVNTGIAIPRNLGLNPWDSKDDLLSMLYLHSVSGALRWKGLSTLLTWNGTGRSTGHTFDPTGTGDDRVVVGDLSLPWPAGTAALV